LAELRKQIPKADGLSDSLLQAALDGDASAKAALEFAITRPAARGLLNTNRG